MKKESSEMQARAYKLGGGGAQSGQVCVCWCMCTEGGDDKELS